MKPIALAAVLLLISIQPRWCRADVVLDWNVTALQTTAAAAFNPPLEARNLAIVHAAMFEAVNSIQGEFSPYRRRCAAQSGASPEAAAVAAAQRTLLELYPEQREAIQTAYAASLASIADGSSKTDGVAVGESAAAELLASRASDGAAAALIAVYAPGDEPGEWVPTPPASRPALDPGWGSVRPFLLEKGSQFRPAPPPALDSPAYTRDFEEIQALGSLESTTRSHAQTELARLWIASGAQNWNPIARQLSSARGLGLSRNARLFALLNLAGADAFIAAWDAKFAYGQWRPVTAIRAADDNNPATSADPAWTPLLPTPPFPDYIAGHSTYAGAMQKVLEHVFGERPGVTLTLTSPGAPGVTKTYTTPEQIAQGVVDARVWGGIHWRTSSLAGYLVGKRVGRYAARHFSEPARAR